MKQRWRKWLGRRRRAAPLAAWFARLLMRYPLPAAASVHSGCRPAAKR